MVRAGWELLSDGMISTPETRKANDKVTKGGPVVSEATEEISKDPANVYEQVLKRYA